MKKVVSKTHVFPSHARRLHRPYGQARSSLSTVTVQEAA